jgi:hypothetical protein
MCAVKVLPPELQASAEEPLSIREPLLFLPKSAQAVQRMGDTDPIPHVLT